MNDFLKECFETAKPLGIDFSTRNGIGVEINNLVYMYSEANKNNNETVKNRVFAALYIRFYKSMQNFYRRVKTTSASQEVSVEDLPSTFMYRFSYVLPYIEKAWNEGKEVNCQQWINRSINTEVENLGHKYGMYDKYKVAGKQISLDTIISTDKDGNDKTISDTIADDRSCATALGIGLTVKMIVEDYFKRKQFDKAILTDAISDTSFSSPRKFITHLTKDDITYYSLQYNVDKKDIKKTIDVLQKCTPAQLNKNIEVTIQDLKKAFEAKGITAM